MTWLPEQAPGRTGFERVLGLRPELRADFEQKPEDMPTTVIPTPARPA
jgi:hypothetical protein